MEKYGAVKIFFGSRWNILVSKPEYLNKIFKNEHIFQKSGNQKKIPYSVLAAYTGDNVISAHGAEWVKYRNIVKDGLQHFDNGILQRNSILLCKLLERQLFNQGHNIVQIIPFIQKLTLDNICQIGLGFDFRALKDARNELHLELTEIKKKIFHPFYLNFPFFDKLPIPSRLDAFADVKSFRNKLVDKVKENLGRTNRFNKSNSVGAGLLRAHYDGELTEKQLADNIVIILVAGHENPQLFFSNLVYLLGKYPRWQVTLRQELKIMENYSDLQYLPLLNAFFYEALRFLPPLSVIINRKTSIKVHIGDNVVIPKGCYVGYHNFGTTHDKKYWGENADQFLPERWGDNIEQITKRWKISKNNCTMNTFHGGKRICLGEKMVLTAGRIFICDLLKTFQWELDPSWQERMTQAGPLCPHDLRIQLKLIGGN
ncbi:Cytochrome P450-DIT2 [Nakaseomyces bracarensis]|uniref:Cytochrome P450-DIT2 n=1 Tax=Nakaseomyces bracarensis TaxID=273131 RepID=A0ABR4NTW3_9SACH